jgi:hypothetical protein
MAVDSFEQQLRPAKLEACLLYNGGKAALPVTRVPTDTDARSASEP